MPITDPNTDIAQIVDRLVPSPQYRGAGFGQSGYTRLVATWFDARPFPSEPDVNAEQVIFLTENPRDNALDEKFDNDIFFKFMEDISFDMENRLRAIEIPPQPALTAAQYRTQLIALFQSTTGTLP